MSPNTHMQNKTARQIQAEIEFMRRAYAARETRHESLNRYLCCRRLRASHFAACLLLGMILGLIALLFS